MLKFALIGKGENLRPRFESSESETTLPQATARRVRSEATNNPSPTTIIQLVHKISIPLVGFPSGQREQTVNLPSSTSKVRILPPPPSLHIALTPSPSAIPHILPSIRASNLPDALRLSGLQRTDVCVGLIRRLRPHPACTIQKTPP